MKNKLHFGTGGVPLSSDNRSTLSGIKRISELGLDLMEMEFVHGVRMKDDMAGQVGELADKLDVNLTIHAPYYINLNANKPEIKKSSRERIMNCCRVAKLTGARSICIHTAFMLGQEMEQVFENVLEQMFLIEEEMDKEGYQDIWLAPEVMGKPTQFADVDELIALADNLKRTRLCFDFAHHFARSVGKVNGYKAWVKVLEKIKKGLGEEAAGQLHIHLSGIEYSAKGERRHLVLEETHLDWQGALKALKDVGIGGYLVCESPNLEEDAVIMKEYYESL